MLPHASRKCRDDMNLVHWLAWSRIDKVTTKPATVLDHKIGISNLKIREWEGHMSPHDSSRPVHLFIYFCACIHTQVQDSVLTRT
jgi:hypothetical protein